ncbi:MAG: HD domain-containing protein [Bacteroidales bacterium]|nr:HD domain-containing protein [Bacteroidales bacterium]
MKNPLPINKYKERSKPLEEDVRGAFFRDQTAIIHSTAFRRMKHKTQVFYAPKNDHICTRIEHVMHVATIAKSICKGLNHFGWNLDVEMAFAIGLGHDLGHAPFGHDGESILNKLLGGNLAFIHEIHSYRVVEYLARHGEGLNLTYGVKDGIITHNGEKYEQRLKPQNFANDLDKINSRRVTPSSYEACIVRFSDKIAYLGRDIEDGILAGLIKPKHIPENFRNAIGTTNSQIIDKYVNNIIETSKNEEFIGLSDNMFELLIEIRNFNYKNIYLNDKERIFPYAERMLTEIYNFLGNIFEQNKFDLKKYRKAELSVIKHFGEYLHTMRHFYNPNTETKRILGDYIAGMTDDYAIKLFKKITIPKSVI